ncbi:protein of unknown function [Chryseobacterium sp. JV274]|nr:protein of unknown function [Chryseobacterium sp. JV274]
MLKLFRYKDVEDIKAMRPSTCNRSDLSKKMSTNLYKKEYE